MRRRTLLQATATAWLAAGASDRAASRGAAPSSEAGDAGGSAGIGDWVLDWLPPAFTAGSDGYAFGVGPAPPAGPRWDSTAEGPWLHLLAPHAQLAVGRNPTRRTERRRVASTDIERQRTADPGTAVYGRRSGRRYRGVAVTDAAVVVGSGPGPEPVLAGVESVATTDGVAAADDALSRLLAAPLGGRYQGVEIDPNDDLAGAADAVAVGSDRSRLRRVLVPEAGADPRRADPVGLPDIGDAPGVVAVESTREAGLLIRDVAVRTGTLQRWEEAGHVV